MILLDSNIIIYATQPEYAALRDWISERDVAVSALSYVEVLGYHRIKAAERDLLEEFFRNCPMIPISQFVLDRAVSLRQRRKMTLGDAIIAGTALFHDLVLVTRNIQDFEWIEQLAITNPFDEMEE